MYKTFRQKASRVLAFLIAITLLFSLSGCLPYIFFELSGRSPQEPGHRQATVYETTGSLSHLSYDELCDALFEHEVASDSLLLNQCVVDPEALGIKVPRPATLGDYSFEATQSENQFYSEVLLALSGLDTEELSPQQQSEAAYIEMVLKQTLRHEEFYYFDRPLSPSRGAQAMLPLSLMDYSFRTANDIDIYLEILEDFPRYFEQLIEHEKEKLNRGLSMPRESLVDTIEEAHAYMKDVDSHILVETFNEMLDMAIDELESSDEVLSDIPALTTKQIQGYKDQNKQALEKFVIPAYKTLVQELEKLLPSSTAGARIYDYKRGSEYYSLKMESMGFDQDPEGAIRTLDKALKDDWEALMQDPDFFFAEISLSEAVRAAGESPEEYVEYVRKHSIKDFAGINELHYSIKVAPDASPNDYAMAYFLIPPVDNPQKNTIVFFPRNISDDVELYNTIAHEAYPGHMYQFFAYSIEEPSNIQKLLGSMAYIEGWAMYTQEYAMRYLDADIAAIESYNTYERFAYALQARVDLGVNYQGWGVAETGRYLGEWGFEHAAQGIYDTCIKQPVAYLPYGLGVIKFIELRSMAESEQGRGFDPIAFHQKITSLGPVPFSMLDAEMNAWIKSAEAQPV